MSEKRYFKRIKFETDSKIDLKGTSYKCELLDISFKGALLRCPNNIPIKKGEFCKLHIHLPSSEVNLDFDTQLIHSDNNHLGFKFESEDLDTMTHHRRLIELNLGGDEYLDNEIDSWLKD